MRINGNQIKRLIGLIKESQKDDINHLSKGLEIEDKNGTKYTIVKLIRNENSKPDEEGDIVAIGLKYYSLNGEKKYEEIPKNTFKKLFKFKKDKKKQTIKGGNEDD